MEQTLSTFFNAVNQNDVDGALECCSDDIQCTYPDPGRNWQGKERGRTVMTAIFGQLSRIEKTASYEVIAINEDLKTVETKESWGHPKIRTKSVYTFTHDNKILAMAS